MVSTELANHQGPQAAFTALSPLAQAKGAFYKTAGKNRKQHSVMIRENPVKFTFHCTY